MLKWLFKVFSKEPVPEPKKEPIKVDSKKVKGPLGAHKNVLPDGTVWYSTWYKKQRPKKHRFPFLTWLEYDEKMRKFPRFRHEKPAINEASAKKRWDMNRKNNSEKNVQEAA